MGFRVGRGLGWWEVTFVRGVGPRLRTHAARKRPWGWGLGGAMFKRGAGPLLRTCVEGVRQHVERRASGVWSSGVCR